MKRKTWFTLHCGAYRSFDVIAINPKNAKNRFKTLAKLGKTHGFETSDITRIDIAKRQ